LLLNSQEFSSGNKECDESEKKKNYLAISCPVKRLLTLVLIAPSTAPRLPSSRSHAVLGEILAAPAFPPFNPSRLGGASIVTLSTRLLMNLAFPTPIGRRIAFSFLLGEKGHPPEILPVFSTAI
jgi:hypothetical protein